MLDKIPMILVAGAALDSEGGHSEFWPNDGLVSVDSALAKGISEIVLPIRRTATLPLLHSIFIASELGHEWKAGLTWREEALNVVTAFIRG